ncbi:MAG: CoB--CoM heterodisulfide reductase iron-sulfur subunit A family protein [bacterium]|nr:CoB--CoM heterodisulfide reductase iron-sulfur subunit A family protein [bacterium]
MGNKKVGAVLVVGGGIGGIQAALDLADSGFKVYLIDRSSTIGGVMAQLDKTFPTNDCSMCIMSPKLVECGRHLNIDIITNAEIKAIEGEAGNFRVTIIKQPRFIDQDRCTGCGVCARFCPVSALDEYNELLIPRAAIFIKYPQAVPLSYQIDRSRCIGCGLCQNLCLAEAIRFDDQTQERILEVGAVILSPGFEEFNPKIKGEYGYGRFPNVLTSIEFERILSASGPYKGHILRPSDGDVPERIAFIQCVGSRDTTSGNDYCSSVCCMYATKEAVISKEHVHDLKSTIFYMDMRAYGKDFDKYIIRAENEYGVRFIRSRVSDISEDPDTNNLFIKFESEDGRIEEEEFHMVVLSVGLNPTDKAQTLSKRLGIELNRYNFCKTSELTPVDTTKPGIFVCGAFQAPKDIPETVIQASAASAKAGALLSESRGSLVVKKEYPKEIDVENLRPRIGAFICHCGINIGGVVNVPEVVEYAKTLPFVVYAERNLYTCSQDTQERMKKAIKEYNLNRVFVAACSPRTHEPLFQETLREAGLNMYLFEMANIRDQCSWVHMNEQDKATEKAKDLVRMGLAKCARIEPLQRISLPMTKRGLVIGGGLSGMVSALNLAEQGFQVCLVEREKELGGNLRHIYYTLEQNDIQGYLYAMIDRVKRNDRIRLYLSAKIKDIEGFVGNYKTTLINEGGEIESFEHGIIIVATGGNEYKPTEYLYGNDSRVITQRELEERIVTSHPSLIPLHSIVMIQCVGSRDNDRPYCSRYCCSAAIKNAIKLKEVNKDINIYILYRDMRTYGFLEDYYKKAREEGVIFIRYDEENRPVVTNNGRLSVSILEPLLKEKLIINPDIIVLSTAITPQDDNKELAQMLKVPLNAENFYLEAHVKLRPVEFATDGVFLAGLCHAPKGISESIQQAYAAVSRAVTLLNQDEIEAEGQICSVDITKCTACGICESVCAYKAIEVTQITERIKAAKVNEALCKGCGTCVATCRCGALDLKGFTDDQIFQAITTFIY